VTMCGDVKCSNGGYCEFNRLESKGYCLCPRPWSGEKCEEANSSLCWDKYEEKVTFGLTSIQNQEQRSTVHTHWISPGVYPGFPSGKFLKQVCFSFVISD